MLALTFSAGINDAVGFLGLDRVFTGNMTGNVVILGMGVAGGEDLPVLGPALALAGFMAGAALAGRALRRATTSWTRATTVLFAIVAVLMFGLAVVLFVVGEDPEQHVRVTATTTAAVAMGVQAATARHVAVPEVSTVVVTSTIIGFAADSVFGNGRHHHGWRRFLAVSLIVLGAAAGTLMLEVHLAVGLLVAGVITAAVTVTGALHAPAAQAASAVQGGRQQ
nr:YoaK family protein [Nocardioides thalensis]